MAEIGVFAENLILHAEGNKRQRAVPAAPEEVLLPGEAIKTVIEKVAGDAVQTLFREAVFMNDAVIIIGIPVRDCIGIKEYSEQEYHYIQEVLFHGQAISREIITL